MTLTPEELTMTRATRVDACRRSLALLLIHHGDSPPDTQARRAVARLRRQLMPRRRPRPAPRCEQATMAIGEKPARRAATDADLTRIREIAVEVMLRCGLAEEELFSPRHDRRLAQARQEIMFRAFHETGLASPQIGRFLGRDQKTVLHGISKHAERIGAEGGP